MMNKYGKFFLVLLLLCFTQHAVFAESAPALTIDAAVGMALKNSTELVKLNNQLIATKEKAENNSYSNSDSSSVTAYLDYQQTLMETSLNKAINETSIEKQNDLIKLTVSEYFTSIMTAEQDLDYYDRELQVKKTALAVNDVKKKFGLISDLDFTTAKLDYDKLLSQRADYEKNVENAYTTLNYLIGVSAANRYELVFNAPYEPLESVGTFNLTGLISNCIEKDSSINNNRVSIATNKFTIDNFIGKNTTKDGVVELGSSTTDSYERANKELALSIADRKNQIEDSVTKSYHDILTQEKQISDKMMELENMKKTLAIKQTELTYGRITQMAYDEYALSVFKQETDIAKLKLDHYSKVMKFKNAHTAVS